MELQAGLRGERFAGMRGELLEVLVDGVSEESEMLLEGRHEGQAPEIDGKVILADAEDVLPGMFVRARVMQTSDHDLVATCDLERELEIDDELAPADD